MVLTFSDRKQLRGLLAVVGLSDQHQQRVGSAVERVLVLVLVLLLGRGLHPAWPQVR